MRQYQRHTREGKKTIRREETERKKEGKQSDTRLREN